MPVVHRFGNTTIKVFATDHNPPHFHVLGAGYAAKITIADLELIAGSLPPRTLKGALKWAAKNRTLLEQKWREYNPE